VALEHNEAARAMWLHPGHPWPDFPQKPLRAGVPAARIRHDSRVRHDDAFPVSERPSMADFRGVCPRRQGGFLMLRRRAMPAYAVWGLAREAGFV